MANSAPDLPQLRGGLFLSDGGLETTLVFQRGIPLPHRAAFVLLGDVAGRQVLAEYYKPYLALTARTPGAGFVLETPTWRANADWGEKLGFDAAGLAAVNRDAAVFIRQLQKTWAPRIEGEVVTAGAIGPRADGDIGDEPGSIDEAARYHQPQAEALREGGVEMLIALTMTGSAEACGVVRAAAAVGLPCAVSFTLETDGRLPSGEQLGDAIARVDAEAEPPAYIQLDCAHPSHVELVLADGAGWRERIRGLRANASTRSHAELAASTELLSGDPEDLGQRYVRLRAPLSRLNVLGGCCGTDERHLRAIARAWTGS